MRIPKIIITQAKDFQTEINKLAGIKKPIPTEKNERLQLEQVVTDLELYKAIHKLFHDGHHAQSVEKAFKFINNLVKKISGRGDLDGNGLMTEVFSIKNPILRFNDLTNRSEQDEQIGYMQIMGGVMTGIRNPRSHEYNWEDTEERALQLLTLANHLVLKVRNSVKNTNNP